MLLLLILFDKMKGGEKEIFTDIRTFFVKQGVYKYKLSFDLKDYLDDDFDFDDDDNCCDTLEEKKIKKKRVKRRKNIMNLLEKEFWERHPTHFLETTRFNQASMKINQQARWEGCLYGNPRPLKKRQQPFRLVLELNNDTNRIDGVGLISNKCLLRGKNTVFRDVYENRLFNQNVYRGSYRLDRSLLDEYSEISLKIFQRLDEGCFHGFYHVKRGNSISKLPFIHILTIQKEFNVDLVDFIRCILKNTYEK